MDLLSTLLTPFKYMGAAVAIVAMLWGLVWFATTHWVLCLAVIFGYVVCEILFGNMDELL